MFFFANTQFQFYRDDLNHPVVSGNKLHKLAPNLVMAQQRGCDTVLSFGGAYSNHLHALAWACREQGLSSIGLVRGELLSQLTPTLTDCQAWGMRLVPIQRKTYRQLQTKLSAIGGNCLAHELLPPSIIKAPNNALVIPEGGSNHIAIDSLANAYRPIFSQEKYQNITHLVCATGTGATLAGLYKAAPEHINIIGVQAVAEGDATIERIHNWLGERPKNVSIVAGHLGGFGKIPSTLTTFINAFEAQQGVPLDPVYNGKVMLKLWQLTEQCFFTADDKVLVLHTGGLQGKRSANTLNVCS